jgi:hypothetical protein
MIYLLLSDNAASSFRLVLSVDDNSMTDRGSYNNVVTLQMSCLSLHCIFTHLTKYITRQRV